MNPACRNVRASILNISHVSGHGHIPTCFSVIESLYAVYGMMRHDPKNPDWPKRDLFVLSKGHAALGHYCVLAEAGYFDTKEAEAFGAFESKLGCHGDRMKVPGVEASTGSLGHGIGIAIGMALGIKIAGSGRRVFTLVGDGESNEGSVWEAVMVAVHQDLENLTVIYDHNKSQVRCLPIPNPAERFRSFGCDVAEVDGHDVEALKQALSERTGKVRMIIADTRKGYGSKTLTENFHEWHRKSPTEEELEKLMEELDAPSV